MFIVHHIYLIILKILSIIENYIIIFIYQFLLFVHIFINKILILDIIFTHLIFIYYLLFLIYIFLLNFLVLIVNFFHYWKWLNLMFIYRILIFLFILIVIIHFILVRNFCIHNFIWFALKLIIIITFHLFHLIKSYFFLDNLASFKLSN